MTSKKKTAPDQLVISRLIEDTNYRTKQTIDTWRQAITYAESLELADYLPLYMLFREIELDGHVHGLIQQRVNRLLGQKFRLVDDAGKEQPEAWKLFETSWFYKFLELAMESRWWHHSLIQLWDVTDNGYKTVKLVNRNHVLPRTGQVSIRQMDQTNLINYREPKYYDWLVECGDPLDLGLFNRAAPNYLIKKNALLEWSKFAQLFGMPIRVGKTASRQTGDMQRMADNLKKMEAAAYAVFQEGETIDFIESTKGDAFQVYKELVLVPNSEMSKLFLGQTMTTDNGSSKSQGEVHERVADGIAESDKRFIQFLVNDELIPRMIKHGFKLDGIHFEWSPTKDLTKLMDMSTKLMQYKNVDSKWLEETFGIPVTDKGPDTPATNPGGKTKLSIEQQQELLKQAKLVNLHTQIHKLYNHHHDR